jgi:glucan phosphoethanolaminetransferase (alkaline phosphatase superfamily)
MMFDLSSRLAAPAKRHVSNIIWSALIFALLIGLDLMFHSYINPIYKFELGMLKLNDIFYIFVLIFLIAYLPILLRYLALGTIFIMTSCQFFFFQYFGTYIQPIHYIQLLPDLGLVAASFFEFIDRMYAILGLITAALLAFLMIERFIPPKMKTYLVFPALIGILALEGFQTYPVLNTPGKKMSGRITSQMLPGPNRLAVDNAYRSLRYLVVGILPKIWSQQLLAEKPLPEPRVLKKAPKANVVLIIDETVRASQLGVLGYKGNDTTPLLTAVDGLYSKSIYAAGTMTRTSWAGILHRLERPGIGKQYQSQSNCLFKLAKRNKFTTHFVYAYDEGAAYTLRSFMCPTYIDRYFSTSDFPKNLRQHDKNLIDYVSKVDFDQPNFIVLGPRGAHTPYTDKSPEELKKFESDYDNAIAYTDLILNAIIKEIKMRSKLPTYVIFTSDHGELLDGESDRLGHGWFREDVVKVPFLFLAINADSDPVKATLPHVDSHFDMTTLIIRLLGYDAKVNTTSIKDVYINGSDLNGLAGYMHVRLKRGKVVSQTISD